MTNTAISVPFHGTNLFIVDHNGQPYTPMRAIVDGMGLSWQPQLEKIKQRFSTCVTEIVMQLPGDNQNRRVVCMALRKLAGWLQTISPNKVRPEIRDLVIQYQEECDDVLYKYWTEGQVVNPRRPVGRPKKDHSGKLSVEQQEAIKQLVLTRGKSVPQEHQAKATITLWSSLKSHFGCSYKEIEAEQFTEALSLAARVPLVGELLERETPSAPNPAFISAPINGDGQWIVKVLGNSTSLVRRVMPGEMVISVPSFQEMMERAGNIIISYQTLGNLTSTEIVDLVIEAEKAHQRWTKVYSIPL